MASPSSSSSLVTINGNSIDLHSPSLRSFGLQADAQDASYSDYILVHTVGPLSKSQKKLLQEQQVVIQEYVSDNTYLCRFAPTDLSPVQNFDFVKQARVYSQAFVIQPGLRTPQPNPAAGTAGSGSGGNDSSSATPAAAAALLVPSVPSRTLRTVDVVFHQDVNAADTDAPVRAQVAEAAHLDGDGLVFVADKVRLTVQEQYLDALAAIDGVRYIQAVQAKKLFNNVAVDILRANEVVLNNTAYQGDGQVVCVGDTGFDKGDAAKPHPAFQGRVRKLYGLGRPGRSNDPDGHGTHVAGSVLGDGESRSMGPAPSFRIQGTAPRATLVLQSLLDSTGGLGGIPDDLKDLFGPVYNDDGARIHTNSWGSSSTRQLPYDSSSRDIDNFVASHRDMVILFAAGNDGKDADRNGVVDFAQIGSQAAAKNCITVGASENERPDISTTYGTLGFAAAPLFADKIATHRAGLAAFSSRGPTKEQRIKPDVVAPGTGILSTRSRALKGTPDDVFGTSSDPLWMYLAGTSMATPLVAGCVAVLRETLVKNGTPSPSAALIKALLINGADEVAGQYTPSETGPSPNNTSGFGLVNLAASVTATTSNNDAPDAGYGEGAPLDEDEDFEFSIDVPSATTPTAAGGGLTVQDPASGGRRGGGGSSSSPGRTLKVTLVWTDPAGASLQNDLDLVVLAAGGQERHGNQAARTATTSTAFDRTNNVERVVWEHIPAGKVTVRVVPFRLTTDRQDFAYAWKLFPSLD